MEVIIGLMGWMGFMGIIKWRQASFWETCRLFDCCFAYLRSLFCSACCGGTGVGIDYRMNVVGCPLHEDAEVVGGVGLEVGDEEFDCA